MNISLIPFAAGWIVVAGAVLVLALYRHQITSHEDDTIHIAEGEASQVSQQAETAHRVAVIDRWGKLLTIIGAVYGVVLGAVYFYQYWEQSSQQMWK
jgi:uncharacterized membrane protein YedE/YeeE